MSGGKLEPLIYKSNDGINWVSFKTNVLSKIVNVSDAVIFKNSLYLTDFYNLYRYNNKEDWVKIK